MVRITRIVSPSFISGHPALSNSLSCAFACRQALNHISQMDLVREELGNSLMIHVMCYKRRVNHLVGNELPSDIVGLVVTRGKGKFWRVLKVVNLFVRS